MCLILMHAYLLSALRLISFSVIEMPACYYRADGKKEKKRFEKQFNVHAVQIVTCTATQYFVSKSKLIHDSFYFLVKRKKSSCLIETLKILLRY